VRLDNLGLVKNYSCFINKPKRIKLLEQRLKLQWSIGRSEEIQKSCTLKKELAEMDKLSPMLSQAIVMYKANETSRVSPRILLNKFCSQSLESHHQTADQHFHPNQRS
jgi:hypothetical protein